METVSLLVISSVIRGIGYALVMGVQFAIIGDAVECGERKTGVRSEGLVFSAQSFGCKVGMGELLIDFTENGLSSQGNPLLKANPRCRLENFDENDLKNMLRFANAGA